VNRGAYDTYASTLWKLGYFPLPIAPGSKAPHRYTPSTGEYVLFKSWQERPTPIFTDQPGAGIGARMGRGIVALDFDNEEAALRVSEALGGSPVNKAGATAWTEFYRTSGPVPSEDFTDENGELMLQVLSDGKQTVLPPSIHPDTGQPYRWTNGASLYNTPPDQLPELPADYRERIMALGYWPGGSKKAGVQTEEFLSSTGSAHTRPIYDDGSPFAELNRLAMKNLTAWIPDLGLKRYRRRRGMHPSYEAVPTWRPSRNGNPTEKRKFNLTISPVHGIVDFGDGRKGYSALSLVMAARGCSLLDAMTWLEERVRPDRGPEVDFEALGRQGEQEKEQEPPADEPPGPDGRERVRPGKLLGHAWYFGDPVPEQAPMLVPFFVPARGFGYLGGQWGTFKTFVVNDLAVAVASGGKFAGQQVSGRGVVIQIELEGSNNEARMLAAATVRECQHERLPIIHLKKDPPKILTNAQPNAVFREWTKQLAEFALAVAAQFDLPLALITVDPQGKVAGFRDEQSSSEGQVVSDAFADLAKRAGCAVLVVDHFGKDATAGLRGTSAKETNPLFILNTSEQQKDTYAKRHLEIRKMRNGQTGLVVDFWMEEIEVQVRQVVRTDTGAAVEEVAVKTLTIRWGEELRPAATTAPKAEKKEKRTPISARALKILGTMINEVGVDLPAGCEAPMGLRGVALEDWKRELLHEGVLGEGRPDTGFRHVRTKLERDGEIAIGAANGIEFVWIPLPDAG
jgi:AAA domain/Bifunctional DNA primase/polymerase, N-terminal